MPTIAAVRVFAVTKLRNADTLTVKAAEFLCFIQIQNIPQGIKFFLLHDVLSVWTLLQVLAQPLVTDIVTLALAQGGKNGCCDMRIVRSASDRNGRYSRTMAFWRAMLEVAMMTGWNGSPSTNRLWLYTMAAVR